MKKGLFLLFFLAVWLIIYTYIRLHWEQNIQDSITTIRNVTNLYSVIVDKVISPINIIEIQKEVKNYKWPISIGWGRFSMWWQIATEWVLFVDMKKFNKIIDFDLTWKTITVQAGTSRYDIQKFINDYNLSVMIMQTYNNFTVWWSLSVNAHGRYVWLGPIINSVISMKIITASGDLLEASPAINKDLFYSAIWWYGSLWIIAEVTLQLADNTNIERSSEIIVINEYNNFFFNNVRYNSKAIFHNCDLYPPLYTKCRAITWTKTNKEASHKDVISRDNNYWKERIIMKIIANRPWGKQLRKFIIDPLLFFSSPIHSRNYEASYSVMELEPVSRKNSTYVLQEYFVPERNLTWFVIGLQNIVKKHKPNIINISIRHSIADKKSVLSRAKDNVFAFVIYYKQKTDQIDQEKVAVWTKELIDLSLLLSGSYYLPYQPHATKEQFKKAYPGYQDFLVIKHKYDPTNKFRNKLIDKYLLNK